RSRLSPARPHRAAAVAPALLLPGGVRSLRPLGFGNTLQVARIDVGEARAHVGRFHALDAARDAVNATGWIDRAKVAPVATGQTPSLLRERRLNLFSVVRREPDPRQ